MRAAVHAIETVLHDATQFVPVGGVIRHDGRVGRRKQDRVSVGVLEAFTGKGGSARRRTDDESACHLVSGRPHGVARALETEHGIEHVDGNQGLAVGGIGGTRCREGGEAAGLIDSDVHDLALGTLLVGKEQFAVHRGVLLAVRVVDLGGGEVRVHPEGASLIRDDRHDAMTELRSLQKIFEKSGESHRAGDLLLA